MSGSPFVTRLTIQDSAYQYPPSNNPYWSKLKDLRGMVFSDNETETHPGHWRDHFKVSNSARHLPLHVEVGCNGGHVITEWAKAHPDQLYIGIDWKFKQIFKGAEKIKKKKLSNVLLLRAHAERLHFMFGEEEVNHLYLFFPDPWPKKAHRKNRFINPDQLHKIARILKTNGTFHIKTDHTEYFEGMIQALQKCADVWEITELNHDLYSHHPAPENLTIPEVTLFEKIFIRDKIPIKSIQLRKLLHLEPSRDNH